MNFKEENIIDFNVASKKKEVPNFSSGLYHWMMFLINLYNQLKI